MKFIKENPIEEAQEEVKKRERKNKIIIGAIILILFLTIISLCIYFINTIDKPLQENTENIELEEIYNPTKLPEKEVCGNKVCDPNEMINGRVYCEVDCIPNCGDGVCEPPEDYVNCGDCSEYTTGQCGNNICETNEQTLCPEDCM